jgi:hypothetical protein
VSTIKISFNANGQIPPPKTINMLSIKMASIFEIFNQSFEKKTMKPQMNRK